MTFIFFGVSLRAGPSAATPAQAIAAAVTLSQSKCLTGVFASVSHASYGTVIRYEIEGVLIRKVFLASVFITRKRLPFVPLHLSPKFGYRPFLQRL